MVLAHIQSSHTAIDNVIYYKILNHRSSTLLCGDLRPGKLRGMKYKLIRIQKQFVGWSPGNDDDRMHSESDLHDVPVLLGPIVDLLKWLLSTEVNGMTKDGIGSRGTCNFIHSSSFFSVHALRSLLIK